MADKVKSQRIRPLKGISRRKALSGLGAVAASGAAISSLPGFVRYAQAQSSEPIKIGFQVHRTGIGAAYGRWYDRTTQIDDPAASVLPARSLRPPAALIVRR